MHQRSNSLLWPVACVVLCCVTGSLSAEEPKKIDFVHDIVPIIKARCAECHTDGKSKGMLSMDTRESILKGKVVVPGKSGESLMVKRIISKEADERMPPKGDALNDKQVELIRRWIDEGAAWESGFTFKSNAYVAPLKPRRPELPAVRESREHPIDRIADAYYAKNKVALPEPLDDTAFIRRVHLDLIGLMPTPEEVEEFVKDSAGDKRAKLVRRLLDDNRAYTEHWLTFWNDLLRNDYVGTGYIDGGRKQITGWLYGALMKNKPYDEFVRELISPTAESEGFIKGIKWRGNVNASQVQELQFSQNVSQVFFGINMKCASCHDSFIDKWKLDDAYSLAAVIADTPLEVHRCDKAQGRKAVPRFVFPELGNIDANEPKAKRLEQMAKLVTHADNGRFTRTIANRLWQRLMGRGVVHPVDVMANRPWSEDLIDYLGVYLSDNKYDLKKLMEHVVTSRTYQSKPAVIRQETQGDEYVYRGPELKRMTAEQFLDAIWMITKTAPTKQNAPGQPPAFASGTPKERQFVRASMVNADALMRSLGRPNREQVVTTRPDLLTTLQALDLSNGQILTDTLARGAANLRKARPKATAEELIEDVYLRALCRKPTADELTTAREIVGAEATAEGIADLLWAVFMLPEFQLIR